MHIAVISSMTSHEAGVQYCHLLRTHHALS